jgi:CubicO group peptidase (beta-lactamase class C family)
MTLPIEIAGNTASATNNYGPFATVPDCWVLALWRGPGGSCQARDVTYKWTAPATARYTISLCGSSYDTCLLVYDFTCPIEPSYPEDLICGNDDACDRESELLAMPLLQGQEILIVADGYGNHSGPFQLTISEYQPAADLEAFIAETMDSGHVPGLAACTVQDGEVTWIGAYGHADLEHGVAVEDTTLFSCGHTSYTITAAAVMQLWEEGQFALDDDIDHHLPFAVSHPNASCADSAVTIRRLLSHTSSIRDNWNMLFPLTVWGGDSPIPLGDFLEAYLVPGGAYYQPANYHPWCPGAGHQYCYVAPAVPAHLVEELVPQVDSFEEYCQDSLFAPLEMNETSWLLAELDSSHVAVPYQWNGFQHVRYPHSGAPYYPSLQLRTSVRQLARFLIAFMQGGVIGNVRILESATVETITTPQCPEFSPNEGLLWFKKRLGGRRLWGCFGSGFGCRSQMFYCPEGNAGAIVLSNGENLYATELILQELFERAACAVPGAGDHAAAPLRLALTQNHPNPFNPSTTIGYSLSRPDRVTLAIYNMLGRKVATLYDGLQQAGHHRVTWHVADGPSGVYFARLENDSGVRTIKMVRVR